MFYKMNNDITIVWLDKHKNACVLNRPKGTCILREGQFIEYEGRETGVRIEKFIYKEDDIGPRGFKYLPWRKEEKRWATPVPDGFNRPSRFIVCYPSGSTTWGEHIKWNTVKHINGGKCPNEI
jgi:hypothetical protein